MKTANEYLDWLGYVEASNHIGDMTDEEWRTSVEGKIEEIQKEAYNQAIQDAADNAETEEVIEESTGYCEVIIDKQSILKLKKQ